MDFPLCAVLLQLCIHQNHQGRWWGERWAGGRLLRHRLLGSTPRLSDSVGQEEALRVCIATTLTGAAEVTSLGASVWEPLLSPTSSQILTCRWLTWSSCENADSDAVGLLGNGRACISNKIPSDTHVGGLQPHLERYNQLCYDAGKGEIYRDSTTMYNLLWNPKQRQQILEQGGKWAVERTCLGRSDESVVFAFLWLTLWLQGFL